MRELDIRGFFLALFVLLLDRLCGVTIKRKEAGKKPRAAVFSCLFFSPFRSTVNERNVSLSLVKYISGQHQGNAL